MAKAISSRQAALQLAELYQRNGYLRRPDPKRKKAGTQVYKKGWEVRLVADSATELRTIRRLLRAVGFEPPRPFAKGGQWRQPIYGRDAVSEFATIIQGAKPTQRRRTRPATRRSQA